MYREPRANLNQNLVRNRAKVCKHESLFNLSSTFKIADLEEGKGKHKEQIKKTCVKELHIRKEEE